MMSRTQNLTGKTLKAGGMMKRSLLKKKGPMANLWQIFRDKKFARDCDNEGLIECQDYKIDLPRCGRRGDTTRTDLHHLRGRDARPDLYFANSNLAWLARECHDAAHGGDSSRSRPEAENDTEGQMGEEARGGEVLSVQGRSTFRGEGSARADVLRQVQRGYASLMEREEEEEL